MRLTIYFSLIASAFQAFAGASPLRMVDGVGGGRAYLLAMDGSRVCAGTVSGIYCKEQDQDSWRLAALQGKDVPHFVKTRSGWISRDFNFYRGMLASWDGGATWARPEKVVGYDVSSRLQAYGDSLIGGEADSWKMYLSEDGGKSWKLLANSIPETLYDGCTPSEQSVLCVMNNKILKWGKQSPEGSWDSIGPVTRPSSVVLANGRVHVQDTLGFLSVYGPAGLERKLNMPRDLSLLAISATRILAQSKEEAAYAYVEAGDSVWTRLASPYPISSDRGLGVWTGSHGVILAPGSTPYRLRLDGEQAALEPMNIGLPNISASGLSGIGPDLLVNAGSGIWRLDQGGNWSPIYSDYFPITGFSHIQGLAWIKRVPLGNAPSRLFSADGMKTWQPQPPSLSGDVNSVARIGNRFLALSEVEETTSSGIHSTYRLFEAGDPMGSWSLRADLGSIFRSKLFTCGSRLFVRSGDQVFTSQDSGKTWSSTSLRDFYPSGGSLMYGQEKMGGMVVSQQCGDSWEPVQKPWAGNWNVVDVNTTGGQPLALVYFSNPGTESRIYPLPGASQGWQGIEGYPLSSSASGLFLYEGVLYVGDSGSGGLLAMDAPPLTVRSTARSRPGATPHRFPGWRRVDGRTLPPRAVPAQLPLFRPGLAR